MSGISGDVKCPRCGNIRDTYFDWKPFDQSSGECLACGFSFYTKSELLSLKDVNNLRKDKDLEPIKKLCKSTDKDFDKEWGLRK